MGPQSKQAVCNTLGHLIDAVQLVEGSLRRLEDTLGRIERLLVRRAETERADLVRVNQRVTALERWRQNGGKPSPA